MIRAYASVPMGLEMHGLCDMNTCGVGTESKIIQRPLLAMKCYSRKFPACFVKLAIEVGGPHD